MLRYSLRRLALALPTLWLTATLVFLLMRLVPGDPAQVLLGENDDPAALARIRADYALDRPLPVQYLVWFGHVLRGDLGQSILQQRPVSQILLPAFGVTASLVVPAVVLAVLIAVPAGTLAAWRRGSRADALIVFVFDARITRVPVLPSLLRARSIVTRSRRCPLMLRTAAGSSSRVASIVRSWCSTLAESRLSEVIASTIDCLLSSRLRIRVSTCVITERAASS